VVKISRKRRLIVPRQMICEEAMRNKVICPFDPQKIKVANKGISNEIDWII
jgi:hypothetical protein